MQGGEETRVVITVAPAAAGKQSGGHDRDMIAICSELFPSSTVKRMERSREK
jgi:hypothetical protein